MNNIEAISPKYYLIPLRDMVIFPGAVAPLFIGREKSINALDECINSNAKLVLVTQKNPDLEDPSFRDLYNVGVEVELNQVIKLPDNTVKVKIEAIKRIRITDVYNIKNLYLASVEDFVTKKSNTEEYLAYINSIKKEFKTYIDLSAKSIPNLEIIIGETILPELAMDNIASFIPLSIEDKQNLLSQEDILKRAKFLFKKIQTEVNILLTEKKIRQRVKKQLEKTQKDYYLNEQMKAIQKEITEGEDGQASEFDELSKKLKSKYLPKEAREKGEAELKKLKMMSPMGAEASVIRNYLDTMLSLPWKKLSNIKSDLKVAKQILDEEHFGIEKVKERITEYLAVTQRTKHLKSPIICLVGPPGVGKTSLAQSIAHATGREFVKFSLGGMKDESEIRGHRKTYIGATTGKILQLLKKAKTSNPVMLLDEIDKLGSDYRGDPSFALLEVLDPEQNEKFLDHYLEIEYDLSQVMFIATANSFNLPRPLLDRMEIIRLSGYTEEEKTNIFIKHLLNKQKKLNGLKPSELSIDEDAISNIIRYYTQEAGVRGLEKEIAKISRKVLKQILDNKSLKSVAVNAENLAEYLGVRKYDYGMIEKQSLVGVTNGLAYSEVGGDLLTIEAVCIPGKGDIKSTGKLGEVMQESAQAAYSYFKSNCTKFGVDASVYQKHDIHIHVPEGATPKDGPSAGIALFTSIVSTATGIPVKNTVAMTGEITLRGRVLPIGGLKEKLLAALRGGITEVIIPEKNAKDVAELPDNIKNGLKINFVSCADDVLDIALTRQINPFVFSNKSETSANEIKLL